MIRFLNALLLTLLPLSGWADYLKFEENNKYRIEAVYTTGSSISLGANHSINSPLCLERYADQSRQADCYWYFIDKGDGCYAIRNASSGQYMVLDEEYTNSPTILRYMHLSDTFDGDNALWYIKPVSSNYSNTVYFQSVGNPSYFFNLRTGSMVIGAYNKGSEQAIPDGANELFRLYDEKDIVYIIDTTEPDPQDPQDPEIIEIDSTEALVPLTGRILHVYCADGRIDAIPEQYIISGPQNDSSTQIQIRTINGATYSYKPYEVDSISYSEPKNLAAFKSFKFNNKYNHHIIGDAIGVFYGDTLITTQVLGIGKTLRPSFKLDDDAEAYIGSKLQKSKISNPRFKHDVLYTVARHGHTILRQTLKGDYVVRPYGHETKVHVDFLTDHSTAPYTVPTIHIYTNDGTMISSKSYYWDATIAIDGGGVFPDMPTTAMQIKGRGNSSWAGTWGKSPYHIKFPEAQKPFGLTKGKHWNLIANAQTRSMTTNAISMKMAQLVETAGFNHEIPVELYINGQYRGSYNFTEKIGLSNNSIDLPSETYATLLELDSYYDETYKFRDNNYSLPVNIKEPDFSENTTALTQQMIEQRFNTLTETLASRQDMQFSLDLDYLARFLFVDEYSANFELMHPKSTFLYCQNIMDLDSKFIFGPVWDFDWGYGYSGNGNYFTTYSTVDYWTHSGNNGQQWANQLRYCGSNFDRIYYNLWHDFLNSGKIEELIDFCDDYYQFAAKSFTHDNSKWGHGDAQTYATVTENAKIWLRQRAEYIVDFMSNNLGYAQKNYLNTTPSPKIGDVNGDGNITTADIVCILNYILSLENEDFYFQQADIDGNDIITVADISGVLNIIGTSSKAASFYTLPLAQAQLRALEARQSESSIIIPLQLTVQESCYSGLQFDLKVPRNTNIEDLDLGHAMSNFELSILPLDPAQYADHSADRYRISIYSSARHNLPEGTSTILLQLSRAEQTPKESQQTISISDLMFVSSLGEDERSKPITIELNNDKMTGISSALTLQSQEGSTLSFRSTEDTILPIYTIDGRLYEHLKIKAGLTEISLPQGIYIINRQKIIIK